MNLIVDIWNHPANRASHWRAIRQAVLWQIWKRITRKPVTIPYHGLRLRCHPDSRQASGAVYFGGWPDYWEMRYVADTLAPGDTFVDVGANIGLYSLLAAAAVGPGGRVIAIEPGAKAGRRLKENIQLNNLGQVCIHACAVGENEGMVLLEEDGEDCMARAATENTERTGHSVSQRTLDGILGDGGAEMVKIDIEGYEPFALRGLRGHLEQGIPKGLLVEVAGYSKIYGIPTEDLLRDMAALGYFPHRYDPDAMRCIPAPRHWEAGLANVLFLKSP